MAITRRVLALVTAAALGATIGALPVAAGDVVASGTGSTPCDGNGHDTTPTLKVAASQPARRTPGRSMPTS